MQKEKPGFFQTLSKAFDNLGYIMKIMAGSAPLFLALALLFSLFSGLGSVAQSFFIGKIVDGVTASVPFQTVVPFAIAIICFQLLAKLQNRTLFALNRVVTEEISVKMEGDILDLTGRIPLSKMDEPGFLNRVEQSRNLVKKTPNSVFMILFGALSLLAGTVGYVIILSRIQFLYVLILIACSVLIFIANNSYEDNVMGFLFAMSPERRKMAYCSELLTKRESFEEIRSYGAAGYFQKEYQKNARKQLNASWGIFRQHTFFYGLAALLAYGGCGLVYVLIIRSALLGRISLGDMTMFLTACLGFQAGLTELTDGLCSLPPQLNALQKYRDLISELKAEKPAAVSPAGKPAGDESALVRVENLTFAYPGTEKTILNGVSLEIKKGECVALVGTNGSGKTTLVRLLSGFYEQYQGTIQVDGIPAVLFQNYLKPSLTVGESIAYATVDDTNREKIEEALKQSGYPSETLPKNLDTNLTKAFAKDGVIPSGGQWQRLALARMFYRDAPLYILDEPSAALDPQAEDEVFRMLASMKGERSVLFITHRLASVSIADRVIYLTPQGQAIQGTHQELMESCPPYRELYELQASKYLREEKDNVGNSDC